MVAMYIMWEVSVLRTVLVELFVSVLYAHFTYVTYGWDDADEAFLFLSFL